MKKILLILICILCIVAAIFFVKRPVKTERPVVPPVNITLNIVPGTENVSTVLKVRMFSRKARQELLNNIARPHNEQKPVQTFTITAQDTTWTSGMSFYTKNTNGTGQKITEGLTLVSAPTLSKFSLNPLSVYEIVYALAPEALPASGIPVFAKLVIDNYTVTSNTQNIPEKAKTEEEQSIREAYNAYTLNDYTELLEKADKLIANEKTAADGYFFKGIALEKNGDYAGALAAFKTSLKKLPHPKKGEFREPPDLLWQKIRLMEEKVNKK